MDKMCLRFLIAKWQFHTLCIKNYIVNKIYYSACAFIHSKTKLLYFKLETTKMFWNRYNNHIFILILDHLRYKINLRIFNIFSLAVIFCSEQVVYWIILDFLFKIPAHYRCVCISMCVSCISYDTGWLLWGMQTN